MSGNFATEEKRNPLATEGEVSAPEGTTEGEVAAHSLEGFRISIRGNPADYGVGGPDWKTVKRIVSKKDYTKFTRTPEVAAAYEARAAKDLQRYLTIGDELHVRLFGALELVEPKSGKTIAAQVSSSQTALVITRNTFPYTLSHEVKHFVLWSRGQLDQMSTKDVRRIVSSNLGIGKKHVVAYKQPEGRNSVPNVSHWQIFVEAKALPAGFQEDQPIRISNTALSTKVASIKKNKKILHFLLIGGLVHGVASGAIH